MSPATSPEGVKGEGLHFQTVVGGARPGADEEEEGGAAAAAAAAGFFELANAALVRYTVKASKKNTTAYTDGGTSVPIGASSEGEGKELVVEQDQSLHDCCGGIVWESAFCLAEYLRRCVKRRCKVRAGGRLIWTLGVMSLLVHEKTNHWARAGSRRMRERRAAVPGCRASRSKPTPANRIRLGTVVCIVPRHRPRGSPVTPSLVHAVGLTACHECRRERQKKTCRAVANGGVVSLAFGAAHLAQERAEGVQCPGGGRRVRAPRHDRGGDGRGEGGAHRPPRRHAPAPAQSRAKRHHLPRHRDRPWSSRSGTKGGSRTRLQSLRYGLRGLC